MTDITGERNLIQQEEVSYRAGITEGTFTRVGAGINFINLFQYKTHSWNLNGAYSLFGVAPGPDGILPVLFDMEIVGYSFYNGLSGTSGTTIIDVHRLSGGTTDNGSIFSTRPEINTSAVDNSYSLIDVVNATAIQLPTGHVQGIFNTTQFLQGDAIRLDLDSSMSGAQNVEFQIQYRPI